MNPVLRELGYSASDRVAVVHADDVGMCHATLPAAEELMARGSVTSASAMVPCPCFPDVVAWKRRQPDIDLGIHLTLTSEWTGYRWGPISSPSPKSGLTDDDGYFHHTTTAVQRNGTSDAVCAEMKAQVDRAAQMGLDATHIDSHMFVAMCERFQEHYLKLGLERRIPAFVPRDPSASEQRWIEQRTIAWERYGQPMFDRVEVVTKRKHTEDRGELVRAVFERLPVGLSCILLHPVADSAEIRQIAGDWRSRVADFDAFRDPTLLDRIHDLGIQLISYQSLRERMVRFTRQCSATCDVT